MIWTIDFQAFKLHLNNFVWLENLTFCV